MTPLPFLLARASKFGGNRSSGLTNVRTLHGSDSGGVGSSMSTSQEISDGSSWSQVVLTIRPDASTSTDNLTDVVLVIHDSPHAEGKYCKGRRLPRCIRISLREGVDVLRIGHRRLDLTPRNLRHRPLSTDPRLVT